MIDDDATDDDTKKILQYIFILVFVPTLYLMRHMIETCFCCFLAGWSLVGICHWNPSTCQPLEPGGKEGLGALQATFSETISKQSR